jgi:hypothetical protein
VQRPFEPRGGAGGSEIEKGRARAFASLTAIARSSRAYADRGASAIDRTEDSRLRSPLRWPNTEQRIHERPTLARFAVNDLSRHPDRFLTPSRRPLDIGDRESRLRRDAAGAQRALLEQQLRQNNCLLWRRRLRHSQNRNRLVAISALGQSLRANSGDVSDEAAVHGVAEPAFQ